MQATSNIPKYAIYALRCPIIGEIRYVGKTCSGNKRIRRHWRPSEVKTDRNRHKRNWVQRLLRFGMRPEVVLIQGFNSPMHLNQAEQYWIMYFRSNGSPLVNVLDGGTAFTISQQSVLDFRAEQQAVASARPETRNRISAAIKKFHQNNPLALEEKKNRLAEVSRQSRTKQAVSAAIKAMWADPDKRNQRCKKLSEAKSGRPHSEEHKLRLRQAASKRAKPVFGLPPDQNTPVLFASLRDASRASGAQPADIKRVINGKSRQAKGWRFWFASAEAVCNN